MAYAGPRWPEAVLGLAGLGRQDLSATFGLPERWIWSDEFYVTTNPYNVTIHPVLNVDERSYDPTRIWPGWALSIMRASSMVTWPTK